MENQEFKGNICLGEHLVQFANFGSLSTLLGGFSLCFSLSHFWVLKITEKVSFNIASEASYVYILSGQKFFKKCQKWSNLASFWKLEACGQTVLPDRSVLIGQKLVENAKIQKFKCDILGDFQTLCPILTRIQRIFLLKCTQHTVISQGISINRH